MRRTTISLKKQIVSNIFPTKKLVEHKKELEQAVSVSDNVEIPKSHFIGNNKMAEYSRKVYIDFDSWNSYGRSRKINNKTVVIRSCNYDNKYKTYLYLDQPTIDLNLITAY